MNLGIRELNESDYEDVLVRWWKDWGWKKAPQKKFLPDNGKGGLMVTLEDKPVCAGFIYFASNADVAWVEWIVSDRNIKENRDEALNYLLETLIGYCEELGVEYLFSNNNNQNLINKFLNLGFIKGSQTTELIKKI